MTADELTWFIPHSANLRILEAISQETGYPMDHILQSVVNYGNTSSASIPIAFCKALDEGRIQSGDTIMMLGFGGGLTYAGIVIRWM
jgi:3-oxoacyl-[acyl-carrier-protein] synthase-3